MTVCVCSSFSNPLSRIIGIGCLVFGAIFYPTSGWGFDFPENLQFHGFIGQGYIWTSANNFFGDSTGSGSFDYRELGLNGSWVPISNLQLSAQILSRRAGSNDEGDLRLDYGFADYTMLSDESNRWGARVGRIRNPWGFYNETRDVIFTRPSVLLPESVYFDTLRSWALSSDGLNIYGERRTDKGDFSLDVSISYPLDTDNALEETIFGRRIPGQLNSELSYLARLLYERDGGKIRAAFSYALANLNYKPEAEPPFDLGSGSASVNQWLGSLQYNAERWGLTSEFGQRKVRLRNFGFPIDNSLTQQFYYIQGIYRFTPKWEGLLRYDVLYLNKNDKNGHKFENMTGFPNYTQFTKDWTIGLNWNISPQFTLRGEYHWVNGTAWLSPTENPDLLSLEQHWNMLAVMAAYRF